MSVQRCYTVTEDDLAVSLGSGDVEVLATPRILAWFEESTCQVVELSAEQTSVGVHVEVDHVAASGLGAEITVTAEIIGRKGRLLRFATEARDRHNTVIATGEIHRVVVDRAGFASRVPQP